MPGARRLGRSQSTGSRRARASRSWRASVARLRSGGGCRRSSPGRSAGLGWPRRSIRPRARPPASPSHALATPNPTGLGTLGPGAGVLWQRLAVGGAVLHGDQPRPGAVGIVEVAGQADQEPLLGRGLERGHRAGVVLRDREDAVVGHAVDAGHLHQDCARRFLEVLPAGEVVLEVADLLIEDVRVVHVRDCRTHGVVDLAGVLVRDEGCLVVVEQRGERGLDVLDRVAGRVGGQRRLLDRTVGGRGVRRRGRGSRWSCPGAVPLVVARCQQCPGRCRRTRS